MPDYVRTYLNERKWLPRDSRLRIGQLEARVEEIYAGLIREGMASGRFRDGLDPRLTALALIGMMNAAAMWPEHMRTPFGQVAGALAELGLRGLLSGRG